MDDKQRLSDEEIDLICTVNSQDSPLSPEETASWLIDLCGDCERHLGWPVPIAGRMAEALPCPKCGRYYFTAVKDESPREKEDDANHPHFADAQLLNDVNIVTRSLLENLLGSNKKVDRRQGIRYSITRPIVGVPLDDSSSPAGKTISMTLIDLSLTGAGVLCDGTSCENLVVFDFASLGYPGVQLLSQVRQRYLVGQTMKMGFEFICDIGSFSVRANKPCESSRSSK